MYTVEFPLVQSVLFITDVVPDKTDRIIFHKNHNLLLDTPSFRLLTFKQLQYRIV